MLTFSLKNIKKEIQTIVSPFLVSVMYEFLAKNITRFFIEKKIIDKSKHEIYEYGFELIFSQTVYILIMIFISVLLNCIIESIVFFLGFYFYRKFSGGYHAKTYIGCHLLFSINQLIFILIENIVLVEYRYLISILTLLFTAIITYTCSPIDHPNKLFTEKEYFRYKKLSRAFIIIQFPISLLILLIDKNNILHFCFCFGIFSASMSLLYAFIERRLKNG